MPFAFLAALAQAAVVSSAPPPPIVVDGVRYQSLVTWEPGEVRCGERLVDGARLLRPMSDVRPVSQDTRLAVNVRFTIDGDGRPRSIAPLGQTAFAGGADIAPSLAASRFPAGSPEETCILSYSARISPLAEAPIEDLIRYTAQPGSPRLPQDAWARIAEGADCLRRPRPQPLVRAFPDHRKVDEAPGEYQWTIIGYDIGPTGETANARAAMGSGNPELNAMALRAVADSRFADANRQGCLRRFVRRAATLPAPPPPDRPVGDDNSALCGGKDRWERAPRLTYPEAYRKRSIEGWALMSYDVAPWGEIDNIRVVESQPSDEFGNQARAMLRMAKAAKGAGATDCTTLVRYEMSDGDRALTDGAEETPL